MNGVKYTLRNRVVADGTGTTTANILVGLCRSKGGDPNKAPSYYGITPIRHPAGYWLWPEDTVERILAQKCTRTWHFDENGRFAKKPEAASAPTAKGRKAKAPATAE